MVGQHGLLLAVSLIKSHFGQLVSKVCECLLRKGSLSLHEIAQDTGFETKRVKNCLLVLVQHNCVQAFSIDKQGPGGTSKTVTLYTAIFENIIHRLRFTKFQDVVAEDLDKNCERVLEALLQHGRLTFYQLTEHAASKKDLTRDVLVNSLNKLVCAHYVERCPKAEPLISTNLDDGQPKRRADKFALESSTLEKQALEAATLLDAERFCGLPGIADDSGEVEGSSPRAGAKRKLGTLDMDKETQASIAENEVLWRANFEKFMLSLRRNLCAARKIEALGPEAGKALKALIDSWGGKLHAHTVSATVDSVFERLVGLTEGSKPLISIQDTISYLEMLGCHCVTENDGTKYYSIDLKAVIKECQMNEVEDLVHKKYGQEAYRIFRFLSTNNQPFETDKISDSTLVGRKETPSLLHKLWKDDYLHVEKLAMAGEYGQKSFFLWKVNRRSLWEHYLDDLYHAAFNLTQRIADIEKETSEIVGTITSKQNATQKPNIEKIRNRIKVLESSLLKLDDKIMLFHDLNCHSD